MNLQRSSSKRTHDRGHVIGASAHRSPERRRETGAAHTREVPWKRLILVLGPARSGTTWVGKVLSLAREVDYLFEPDVVGRRPSPHAKDVGALFSTAPWREFDRESLRIQYEAFYRHLEYLYQQMRPRGGTTLLVKIPRLEHALAFDYCLRPDVIVVCRRHPLGILNSYLKNHRFRDPAVAEYVKQLLVELASQERRSELVKIATECEDPRALLVLGLGLAYRHLEDIIGGRNWRIVDYDLACLEPEKVFRNLYEFCSLEWTAAASAQVKSFSSPERESTAFHSWKKMSIRRATAWRRELPSWTIKAAGMNLVQCGFTECPLPGQGLPALSVTEQIQGIWEHARRSVRWRCRVVLKMAVELRNRMLGRCCLPR